MTQTQTRSSNYISFHVGQQEACSAAIGARVLLLKKSATELKSKLL